MQPKALWAAAGFLLLIAGIFLGIPFAHAQVFTDNLYFGLQDSAQVSQLQEFLTSEGLYTGPITGNFYFLTLNAVKIFQTQQGISPAAGYFGPITMAAANKIADAEVSASNAEAISETGTSTPPAQGTSTVQLQLQALLQQVALLQQELQTQQSSTQEIQTLQTQVQQQSQTLQQIAQNTQPQAPTVSITANGSTNLAVTPYDTAATISWSSKNASSCNVSPMGWPGTSGSQIGNDLTMSQTYSVSCTGAGGTATSSVTVNVSAQPVGTLTIAQNPALGSQSVSAGVTNQKIGSYSLTASSIETVKINEIDIEATPNATANDLQNLHLLVNGSPFGQTVSSVAAGSIYKFLSNGTSITVPADGTVNADVYADTLWTDSGTVSPATVLSSCSAVGQRSNSSISCSQTNGQTLSFGSSPTITVLADATDPPAGQTIAGSTEDVVAVFRFAETSNIENVKIANLNITDTVSPLNASVSFTDLALWNGTTLLGTSSNPTPISDGYVYAFHLTTPIIVPQAGSVSVMLKVDATSSTDGSSHTFSIASTSDITALGATSNKAAVVNINGATGNPQTMIFGN
ncbi:MAG: peptidoglycan-binding domain-containing protein [Candidatus Sulfotelmatobacter sp.]